MMTWIDYVEVAAILGALIGFYLLPVTLIIRRTGHSGWWILLTLIPPGPFIGLWLLALGKWPALETKSSGNQS